MNYLIAILFVCLPSLIGLIRVRWFVVFVLATGPLTIGYLDHVETPLGSLDVMAIKLFGVFLPTITYLLLNPQAFLAALRHFWFHLVFLIYATLSLLWTPDIEFGLRMLIKLWTPFLFLCVVSTVITRTEWVNRLATVVVYFGLVYVAVAAVAQVAGLNRAIYFGMPGLGPSAFSAYLAAIAMLPMAVLLKRRHLVEGIKLGLIASAIYLSFTRITIAGFLVGAATMVGLGGRGPVRVIAPAAIAVSAFLLFFATDKFKERMFLTAADQVSTSTVLDDPVGVIDKLAGSGRYAAWSAAFTNLFDPNPIFGSGIGSAQAFLYSDAVPGVRAPHSDYVRLLCETGIVGTCLFGFAAFSYLRRLVHWLKARDGAEGSHIIPAALAALIAYLLYLATDNGLDYVNAVGLYVFALIGMAFSAHRLGQADQRSQHARESATAALAR